MARGLPCIGTGVGGIPELLQPEDLVPPNDAAALGRKLREVIADRRRMQEMSARNHERAKAFDEGALHARRTAFYRFVRNSTEQWIHNGCQLRKVA
jgi:glycosyltransferase involved in cell wall biosynthesis